MATIKTIYSLIRKVFLGFWGLTVIDLMPMFNIQALDGIDGAIKTGMALIGAIYLLIQIPFKLREMMHKKKMNKTEKESAQLSIDIQRQELRKLEIENSTK